MDDERNKEDITEDIIEDNIPIAESNENCDKEDGDQLDDCGLDDAAKTGDSDVGGQIPVVEEIQVSEPVNQIIIEPKKKKGKVRRFFGFVALALIFSLLGGTVGSYMTMTYLNNGRKSTFDASNASTHEITINVNDEMYYAAAVAEKAQKWVVGVTTLETVQYETIPFFGFGQPGSRVQQGVGSGVIVNPNGYILTNSHVVSDGNADEINVVLIDGTTEPAVVLWNNPTLDLAVIKIEREGLAAAEFGDSDSLIIGEPVVAIGNPMTLDLERTVTNGIISGLDRAIRLEDSNTVIKPLIQTNASINPGNSGGPLLNAEGKVIGINTAKMSSAEGLGFSIPVNTAMPILRQIIDDGAVSTAYMGIEYMSVADYSARIGVDISQSYGIIIVKTVPDSPAHKAGFKMGDIIIGVDNTKIEESSDLVRKLYEYKAGETIRITFIRDNEEMTTDVTLMEKPAD